MPYVFTKVKNKVMKNIRLNTINKGIKHKLTVDPALISVSPGK